MMSSNLNSVTRAQGFKKKSSATVVPVDPPSQDKFDNLKSKLEKQKQLMKKTGKRFREQTPQTLQQHPTPTNQHTSTSTSTPTPSTILTPPQKHDISIGGQQPIKQTISLKELGMEEGSGKIDSMKSSQLFQNQFKEQKRRTQDLCRFLMDLGLQEFGGALVQNGFDQVDMLVDLTTEDMNMVMMRAHQQIKLMEAIKTLRPQTTPQTPKLSQDRLQTSTIRHLKTQPTLPPPPTPPSSSSSPQTSTSQLLKKQKSKSNSNSNSNPLSSPQLSSGLMANSFLYTVGNRNWSIQDQVRRACSVCFKLEQQMQKKGECYYCEGCFKIVSDDLLGISIGRSMKYQKLQNQ